MELKTTIKSGASEALPNHRLSAVGLTENEEECKPMDSSMAMQGALKRRDHMPFESPDGKLAVELEQDIPSTMHKPPPRKTAKWGGFWKGFGIREQ